MRSWQEGVEEQEEVELLEAWGRGYDSGILFFQTAPGGGISEKDSGSRINKKEEAHIGDFLFFAEFNKCCLFHDLTEQVFQIFHTGIFRVTRRAGICVGGFCKELQILFFDSVRTDGIPTSADSFLTASIAAFLYSSCVISSTPSHP